MLDRDQAGQVVHALPDEGLEAEHDALAGGQGRRPPGREGGGRGVDGGAKLGGRRPRHAGHDLLGGLLCERERRHG